MRTTTKRQRSTLYAGIADEPTPSIEEAIKRFDHGFASKPHTTMMHLFYDLHRFQTRPARRPLPGITQVS